MTLAVRAPSMAPTIETDLTRSYGPPPAPPDDVRAVRETGGDRIIWERLSAGHLWVSDRNKQVLTWKELIARGQELREHHLPVGTVWVVRSDAIIPPQVHGIYSNEPAAIAAAGGSGDRRVHPWQVLDRPEEHDGSGPGGIDA